jgi:hypothetical protein
MPPGFIKLHWPGPDSAPPPVVLGTALATGVIAAATLPLDRPGIGWLVSGVAAAMATSVLARGNRLDPNRPGPNRPGPAHRATRAERVQRALWGTAAVALLAVGTVRAAGWLFVLCVMTACVAGSLAVGGGTRVAGLLRGAFAVPFAGLRALPWAARGTAALRRNRGGSPLRTAATIGLSLLLLFVFGSLFTSADAAFANIVDASTPEIGAGTVFRWIFVGVVVGLGTLGAGYVVAAPPRLDGGEPDGRLSRVRRLEWLVPLVVLDALFLSFVLVQLTVWFGGARHVLETAGLTYAEYARGGFWQLLAVTLLTLAVIGGVVRWAPREQPLDRLLVRTLLGILATLTLVIVASALHRMHVYEQAYGFTRLRVLVSLCEAWLGLVFLMVLAAGVRMRVGWLPRAVVGSAMIALIGLAVANPDRFIADRNVDRFNTSGRIDTQYLSGLSADAVPALDRLAPVWRDCALEDIADRLHDPDAADDWRGFNLARVRAREILAARPVGFGEECWRQIRG